MTEPRRRSTRRSKSCECLGICTPPKMAFSCASWKGRFTPYLHETEWAYYSTERRDGCKTPRSARSEGGIRIHETGFSFRPSLAQVAATRPELRRRACRGCGGNLPLAFCPILLLRRAFSTPEKRPTPLVSGKMVLTPSK